MFWRKQLESSTSIGSGVAAAALSYVSKIKAINLLMACAVKVLIFSNMLAAAASVELASHSEKALQRQISDEIVGGNFISQWVRLIPS